LASSKVSRRRFIGTSLATGLAGIVPWGRDVRKNWHSGNGRRSPKADAPNHRQQPDGYGVTVFCGATPIAQHNGGGEFSAIFQNEERSLADRTENWRARAWTGDEAHITLDGE
jgi:hypothetical protein